MTVSGWPDANAKRAFETILALRRRVAEDNSRGLGTLFSILEKLVFMSDQEIQLHLERARHYHKARERVLKASTERESLQYFAACDGNPASHRRKSLYRQH
jgi:tetrahydrodipicolinate N-succinyltransferase